MEKTIEFDNIEEFSKDKDVNAKNTCIEMHYDKTKKKYITTIEYEKKT